MHEARLVPVGCTNQNQSQKPSLELESLDRKQIVTMKRGTPVSPASVYAGVRLVSSWPRREQSLDFVDE